ncbi:hypothetical protein [Methanothrix soehngenii]|jgi:hypothetical protein|uniref:Uncharacterized protein n=1 Tax=Candidatus Methanofastidiosum methylothiophilum TaxID=1705564 RepID=A0A150J2Z8_9EURY|nr:MAG: hypothetical protein AMQ74_01075 [Candidatus Methanofastidiosum methylthiophilus]
MNDESNVFGDARVIPASKQAKAKMNHLKSKGLFKDLGDIWRLGAALGLLLEKSFKEELEMETFENINSLDPEGILAATMIGLYPDLSPKERMMLLVEHAEWGINEIHRMEEIGTLDFTKLGL